jgi:tetratricopeptide (TPR) repeat protein
MHAAANLSTDALHSPPGTRERSLELTALAYRCRHDDTRRALGLAREALSLADALGDRPARAWALLRVAVCELIVVDAQHIYEDRTRESLALMRELGDYQGERDALSLLGDALALRGDVDGAVLHYRAGVALCRRHGDREGEARALNNLGKLLLELARTGEALDCLRQSLQLALTDGDHGSIAYAHVNLGAVFLALDDPAAAVEHFEQAFVRVTRTENRALECSTLTRLAQARALQGALDEAHDLLRHAQGLARRTGNVGDLARVSLAQAAVEQGRGRHATAEAYLHAALSSLERKGEHLAVADALLRLAHSQWQLGQAAQALEAAARAESLAQAVGHAPLREAAQRMTAEIRRQAA